MAFVVFPRNEAPTNASYKNTVYPHIYTFVINDPFLVKRIPSMYTPLIG